VIGVVCSKDAPYQPAAGPPLFPPSGNARKILQKKKRRNSGGSLRHRRRLLKKSRNGEDPKDGFNTGGLHPSGQSYGRIENKGEFGTRKKFWKEKRRARPGNVQGGGHSSSCFLSPFIKVRQCNTKKTHLREHFHTRKVVHSCHDGTNPRNAVAVQERSDTEEGGRTQQLTGLRGNGTMGGGRLNQG